jgi:hypothetical protein
MTLRYDLSDSRATMSDEKLHVVARGRAQTIGNRLELVVLCAVCVNLSGERREENLSLCAGILELRVPCQCGVSRDPGLREMACLTKVVFRSIRGARM